MQNYSIAIYGTGTYKCLFGKRDSLELKSSEILVEATSISRTDGYSILRLARDCHMNFCIPTDKCAFGVVRSCKKYNAFNTA